MPRCGGFRQYRQIGFIRQEAAVTQAFVYRQHQSKNARLANRENCYYKMDREAELKEKDRLLSLAMERLSSVQREVIQRSYLDNEGEFDYISCGEMRISESTYRRIKLGALELMAAALGLEVYLRVNTGVR